MVETLVILGALVVLIAAGLIAKSALSGNRRRTA